MTKAAHRKFTQLNPTMTAIMTSAANTAIQFAEDFKFSHGDQLEFDAKSFQRWLDETLPQAATLEPTDNFSIDNSVQLGSFALYSLPANAFIDRRIVPCFAQNASQAQKYSNGVSGRKTSSRLFFCPGSYSYTC